MIVPERFLKKIQVFSGSSCLKQLDGHNFLRAKMDFSVITYKKQESFYFRLGIDVFCNIPERLFRSDFYKNVNMFWKLVSQATRRTFFCGQKWILVSLLTKNKTVIISITEQIYFALVRKGCSGSIFTKIKVCFESFFLKEPDRQISLRVKIDGQRELYVYIILLFILSFSHPGKILACQSQLLAVSAGENVIVNRYLALKLNKINFFFPDMFFSKTF